MKLSIICGVIAVAIVGVLLLLGNNSLKAQEPPPAASANTPAVMAVPSVPAPTAPAATPVAAPAAKTGGEAVKMKIPVTGNEPIAGATVQTNVVNQDLITIALDDVPMDQVVKMFTQVANVNIVADPSNLHGRVTVNLRDVEWKPAFEAILSMHDMELVERTAGSRVYNVVPKVPGALPQMSVETVFLKYASVSNVMPVVTALVAEHKGTVQPFSSKNALVIKTTSQNLAEIKQVIEKIDKLRDQVFIEAKFMELSDSAIKDLGINWQVLQAYQVGASGMQMNYSDNKGWNKSRTDTSSTWDKRDSTDNTTKLYDKNGQQYEQQTIVFTESPPGSGNYVQNNSTTATRTTVDSTDQGKNITSDITDAFTDSINEMKSAVLSAADFNLILSALSQMDGIRIVSNPKIIVANEQPATIHIGEIERPFISSVTASSGAGIAPIVSYNPGERLELGVKLTVTPTVNTESNITVRIEPELTRFEKNDVAPNGQTYPIISTKTISTVFCLESGKTVAIGGLTETTENETTEKIPLLGDIPIIGKYLFSHSHTEEAQSETIIFVTVGLAIPETMQKDNGLPEETFLAKKQDILSDVKRRQRDIELQAMKEQASKDVTDAESAKTKERLLKRSK